MRDGKRGGEDVAKKGSSLGGDGDVHWCKVRWRVKRREVCSCQLEITSKVAFGAWC